MPLIRSRTPSGNRSLAACASGALLVLFAATAAFGADRADLADARAAYKRDRAACISGQSNQDRATCLKEAGAALQEARRGRLSEGPGEFDKNRLLRCDRQPPEDRQACVRRMNGEGYTSGSVAGGGIYRELVVPVEPAPGN